MQSPLPPGFMVVHGNRLEDLRDLAVDFVKAHPLPPLLPEVFLVQSNGMKHWLELALAREEALGICAATRMELPARLLWEIYRGVLGQAAVPEQMPFDKPALVWRLVRLLPELAAQDEVYAPLRRYLADDADGRRRYQLALQLADVFDGYQSYRSDWLDDWAQGQDLLRGPNGSRPLPSAHAWQARLWRALLADVGEDQAQASRAAVHARFMRALQAHDTTGPRPAGVPPRIVVFGISSLPQQTVEALAALGRVCQVLMLVQNPCRHHWGHVVEGRELLRPLARHRQAPKPGLPAPGSVLDAAALHAQANPLLASWGKQGRDYLHLLDEFELPEQAKPGGAPLQRIEVFVDPADGPGTPSQLTQLQSDILELEPLPAAPRERPDDGAITLLMAHSAQREVEVLHDRLLAWFDADPSLSPREVMVMVPDMAGFLPHIQAVFGRFAAGHPRHVPFSVADRSPRQSPLVQALERLLELPTSRITLADWLGLFEVAAVRKRFDLSEADVAQLQGWLEQAGVRWGLDAAHRRAWGLAEDAADAEQNTWAFGLRRMLLGYATAGGAAWQDVLPLGEVGGLGAQLVGRLAEWVEAMSLSLQDLRQMRPPAQWQAALQDLLQRFFAPATEAEERLLRKLCEQLAQWRQRCDEARLTQPLPLVVVREHWLAQIETPGLQQRFFGGGVQFATLMPMRTIPFRVVCLLGMNDADYPRQAAPRDFDLMAHSWRPGDRSRREDDRYLFLEALLSAREKLYISWQGHRATDNAELPPSVLVAQLQDELRARFVQPPRPQLQPLQAFSARYFEAGSPFFSYADDWQQALAERTATPPAAAAADSPCPTELTLEALERLLRQPVEVYWRSRLGVRLEQPQEAAQEDEPFALDGLAQYQIGQQLLQAPDQALALQQLQLSGQLPMAAFGRRLARQLLDKASEVQARAPTWLAAYPEPLAPQSVALDLGGARLTGTLRELHAGPDGWLQLAQRPGAVLEGKEGRKTPRHAVLTALWLRHVVASAMGAPLTSVLLGVDGQVRLAPLAAEQAHAILQDWLAAYRAAWSRPLPVTCQAALACLQALSAGSRSDEAEAPSAAAEEEALTAARNAFDGGFQRPGEWERSAYVQRAFERFDAIEAELPHWAQQLYGHLVQEARAWPNQAPRPEEQAA